MSEWKEHPLGKICSVQNGYCFKSGEFLPGSPGRLEVVKMGHIQPGGGLRKAPKRDYVEREARLTKWILDKGDIILAMTDMKDNVVILGVPALIDKDDHYVLNQRVARLKLLATEEIDLVFLFNYLKWRDFLLELQSKANSGVQVNLTTDSIKASIIRAPSLPEQQAIAEVLSRFDAKIDLLHRQNETLEALAETLFRHWFIEVAEKVSEVGTLEDEFEFTMGQSPVGSSLNEDRNGVLFFQGRSDFGFRFPEPRVYTTEPNRLAKKFDTLVSVRAPVGDMNMAIEDCCLGRGVAAFRYRYDSSFSTYTYYKLRSLMAQIKQFEDSGTVFGSIGKVDFNTLENVIPQRDLVQEFQRETSPLDAKIYKNTIQILTLTNLRDELLPKLMSGSVRVNP